MRAIMGAQRRGYAAEVAGGSPAGAGASAVRSKLVALQQRRRLDEADAQRFRPWEVVFPDPAEHDLLSARVEELETRLNSFEERLSGVVRAINANNMGARAAEAMFANVAAASSSPANVPASSSAAPPPWAAPTSPPVVTVSSSAPTLVQRSRKRRGGGSHTPGGQSPHVQAAVEVSQPPQPPGPSELAARPNLSEVLPMVLPWVHPAVYVYRIIPAATRWTLQWYTSAVGAVIVPDNEAKINAAINRSGGADGEDAATGPGPGSPGGLVLVRPGLYQETVRITRSCFLFGLGPREKVVIEAPGWESPLVFVNGEDALVANVTIRCRIAATRGKCVYIPTGRPRLERCKVEGGVHACGSSTAPRLHVCEVCGSPGYGVHFSDGCAGEVLGCTLERNKLHGVLVDREACPNVTNNRFTGNSGFGVRIHAGKRGAKTSAPAPAELPHFLGSNDFIDNKEGDVFIGGGFEEGQEDDEDDNEPAFSLFD